VALAGFSARRLVWKSDGCDAELKREIASLDGWLRMQASNSIQ
jgi:hypothetical protein